MFTKGILSNIFSKAEYILFPITFEILKEADKLEGFAPGMHQLHKLAELKDKLKSAFAGFGKIDIVEVVKFFIDAVPFNSL